MIDIMSDFAAAFSELSAREDHIMAGAHLFHENDAVRTVYLVWHGEVDLIRVQPNGNPVTLQRATAGNILAEASVYAVRYHCDAIARQTSVVRSMPKRAFVRHLREDADFHGMWSALLAREVQTKRGQVEILARRTVADRLDGWLTWHGGELPEKGHWKAVASDIGVSPEALYREIAKRQS